MFRINSAFFLSLHDGLFDLPYIDPHRDFGPSEQRDFNNPHFQMEEPDEPTRWFEPPIPSLTAEESAAARAPFFSPAFPPPPAIRYACACLHELTPPTRDADRSNNSIDRSDAPPSTPFGLWTLEDLLFCPSCNALKCPRCVNEELQDAYCPACLFDMVMTNVARVERNRWASHRRCWKVVTDLSFSSLND